MLQGRFSATAHFVGAMNHVRGPLIGDICVYTSTTSPSLQSRSWSWSSPRGWCWRDCIATDCVHRPRRACLFTTKVNWCLKLYSATGVRHDPARIEGLLYLRRPETGGELHQPLSAVNWLHTHLAELARISAQLRDLMKKLLRNFSRRTKRAATAKKVKPVEWTTDCQQSCTRVKHLLGECVILEQPCEACTIMVFTDTSDIHWWATITEAPDADLLSGVHPCEVRHAPLAFVGGSVTRSKLRWATLDKDAFAVVEIFRRLEGLL